MQELTNAKTKIFTELFKKKDALGIDDFTEKNEAYKNIYRVFKGRFYFTEKDNFELHFSPDNKTIALVCYLDEPDPAPKNKGINLEIHVAKTDKDGIFHRSEQIRYDFLEDIKFDYLENNTIVVYRKDNPDVKIHRKLKLLPRELTLSTSELAELLEKEAKIRKLQAIKIQHCKQASITPKGRAYSSGNEIRNKVSNLLQKERLMPDKRALIEWNPSSADTMLLL